MTDLRASLSPRDYVDADVFATEAEDVLAASWMPVCRADQLRAAGDRFAVTLAGRPVVAVRDQRGDVRVLANVCAHRGSVIVDHGAGHDAVLVCPYHRWAYRLDGSFVGAPLADGADLDGVCVPVVRHTVWNGFVLANVSGDAPEPTGDLAGLAAAIEPWRWDELVTVGSRSFPSTWNWKVMVENWIECYHHLGTHRETIEPIQPARTTKVVPGDGGPWAAMTVDTVEDLAGDQDRWIPGVTADRSRDLSVWAAFPLLLGGSIARYAFWLHVVPIDATRHTVTWNLLAHPDQLDRFTPDVVASDLDTLAYVHGEDTEACERVQAGLASGLLQRFRLTPLEAPIADFQRWVAARLGRGAASRRVLDLR
jgi:phenylpropionate dioxygenase-like ring-hydroxylating dioxygenase large terminal subunit